MKAVFSVFYEFILQTIIILTGKTIPVDKFKIFEYLINIVYNMY